MDNGVQETSEMCIQYNLWKVLHLLGALNISTLIRLAIVISPSGVQALGPVKPL